VVGFDKRIVLVRASAGEPPIPAVTDHEHVAGAARHLAEHLARAGGLEPVYLGFTALAFGRNSCVVGISWVWFCTGFLHQENPKRSHGFGAKLLISAHRPCRNPFGLDRLAHTHNNGRLPGELLHFLVCCSQRLKTSPTL
jgi:hypothetical protein